MTTWADAHARAAVLASQLHNDLGFDLERPIDVFAAVQRLGIVLAFDDLGSTSGLYLPVSPQQRFPGILLNSKHPRSRQRYTAGHELGHHVFGHEVEIDGELEGHLEAALERGTLDAWSDQEKEAEAFGAWFLMPRRLLRTGMQRLGISNLRHPLEVYELSLWLGTSYAATARQLGATRLLDLPTANRWASLPPKQFKLALSEGLEMASYRNDVWWLDKRAHQQPIDLRPGDRLVVSLSEDVSTGHTWTFASLPANMRLVADSFVDDWEPRLEATWAGEASSPPREVAGGLVPRTFVLDVSGDAEPDIVHLLMTYGREWESDPVESFELLIAIVAPMYGVQLSEEQLAVAG